MSGTLLQGRPLAEVKADLFRALAHPARIRVLEILAEGERSVGDLQPLVGIESSHLSQQLAVLRTRGPRDDPQGRFAGGVRDPRPRDRRSCWRSARRLLINSLSESQGLLEDLLGERPA